MDKFKDELRKLNLDEFKTKEVKPAELNATPVFFGCSTRGGFGPTSGGIGNCGIGNCQNCAQQCANCANCGQACTSCGGGGIGLTFQCGNCGNCGARGGGGGFRGRF